MSSYDNQKRLYNENQATDCASERRMTTREKLEMRRNNILSTIKYNQQQLEQIEDGIKLLNKNKELEILINLSQL